MLTNDQTVKRSKFLTAFCFISLLISIGFIGASFFGLKQIDDYIDQQLSGLKQVALQTHTDVKDMPMYNIVQVGISSISGPVVTGIYLLIGFSILSFIAVLVMMRMKKVGFYIFAFANIIMCSGMIYAFLFLQMPAEFEVMRNSFLYGAIISFLQIIIFAFQLKNLR